MINYGTAGKPQVELLERIRDLEARCTSLKEQRDEARSLASEWSEKGGSEVWRLKNIVQRQTELIDGLIELVRSIPENSGPAMSNAVYLIAKYKELCK